MNIKTDERTAFLLKELYAFEKMTEMSDKERAALYEWVSDGNSVHENGSVASCENGKPMNFLDVYRHEEAIRQDLEKLTPAEQAKYIARLQEEDTIETLMEDLSQLSFKAEAYRRVLKAHGLLSEAEALMKSWKSNVSDLPEIDDDALLF